MFSTADTIVAIATPPGRGGIGGVRLSGPRAMEVAGRVGTCGRRLAPRHATLTFLRAQGGHPERADEIVATFFPAPHSYTGEDIIELSAHGSPVIMRAIVSQ